MCSFVEAFSRLRFDLRHHLAQDVIFARTFRHWLRNGLDNGHVGFILGLIFVFFVFFIPVGQWVDLVSEWIVVSVDNVPIEKKVLVVIRHKGAVAHHTTLTVVDVHCRHMLLQFILICLRFRNHRRRPRIASDAFGSFSHRRLGQDAQN